MYSFHLCRHNWDDVHLSSVHITEMKCNTLLSCMPTEMECVYIIIMDAYREEMCIYYYHVCLQRWNVYILSCMPTEMKCTYYHYVLLPRWSVFIIMYAYRGEMYLLLSCIPTQMNYINYYYVCLQGYAVPMKCINYCYLSLQRCAVSGSLSRQAEGAGSPSNYSGRLFELFR